MLLSAWTPDGLPHYSLDLLGSRGPSASVSRAAETAGEFH